MRALSALLFLFYAVPAAAQQTFEQWRLDPDLRIGSVAGPNDALTRITDLAVARDGTMYLLQPLEQRIRVFSRQGQYLRTIGRRGEGPGEFLGLQGLGWLGDTLWVSDAALHRITLFSQKGEVISSVSATHTSPSNLYYPTTAKALLADGSAIVQPVTAASAILHGRIAETPLLKISYGGVVLDTLARLSVEHQILGVEERNGPLPWGSYSEQPISDQPLWVARPSGSGVAIVRRPAATEGQRNRATIVMLNLAGDTVYVAKLAYNPLPVIDTLIEEIIRTQSSFLMRTTRGRVRAPARARKLVREALYIPAFHPPISGIVAGRNGQLWLRREDLHKDSITWTVLGRGGQIAAQVRTRRGLRILMADEHYIWGTIHDELQVPYLHRFRIVRLRNPARNP